MKIPNDPEELRNFLCWLIECCTNSQNERRPLYEKRRRYMLFGQNKTEIARVNELDSHVSLLRSFLFAPDQVSWSISAPPNADDAEQARFLVVQDTWNDDASSSGLTDAYNDALLWSIGYDTMILKSGWNDRSHQGFAELVEPGMFGVFEEYRDFDSQQAYTQTFVLDYDDACERLIRAGLAKEIPNLRRTGGGASDLGLPSAVSNIIIAATGGGNAMGVAGNVQGTVNTDFESSPSYAPKVPHSVCAFHEVTVFDSDADDWRFFHVIEPDIVLSDSKRTIEALKGTGKIGPDYDSPTNFFLKGEHPFTAITPYPLYNYVWGRCHLEDLIPLQNWLLERLTQIDEILETQADPAKSFAGYSGLDDERMEAWGGPGTYAQDPLPGAKAEIHYPTMPEDLFSEFDRILALFMERSGMTEIMAGRGERNVRGRGHARELRTTGAGRVRNVATRLESSLTQLAEKGLRLKAKNDKTPLKTTDGEEFVLAQVLDNSDYRIRISGHSHSPLFTMESAETAFALLKAKAISREWLLRLIKPPHLNDLITDVRKIAKQEQAQQQAELAAKQAGGKSGRASANAA